MNKRLDFSEPEFPTGIGDEVYFVKAGQEYRLTKRDEGTWLIHKRETRRELFELIVTSDGKQYLVEGRGHLGPISAMGGVSKGILFTKLF